MLKRGRIKRRKKKNLVRLQRRNCQEGKKMSWELKIHFSVLCICQSMFNTICCKISHDGDKSSLGLCLSNWMRMLKVERQAAWRLWAPWAPVRTNVSGAPLPHHCQPEHWSKQVRSALPLASQAMYQHW